MTFHLHESGKKISAKFSVLGLNLSNNGSVCVMRDGKIVFYLESERITRKKRDHAIRSLLKYVHDIDVSDISSNPRLRSLIARLPGRRIIFTNGSIRHAERITNQLGVLDLFGDIFDIVASEFIPKPDPRPYNAMIKRFNIDPKSSIMIEDMAKNLIPAAALGMITVWLQHDRDWSKEGAEGDHINYKIDDLEYWLEELTNREGF